MDYIATRNLPFGVIVLALAGSGCADPCVDDGLGQDYCPEQATDGGSGGGTDGGTVGTDSDGTTDPTVGTGGGGGMECPLLDVTLTPQEATTIILVDQSESMTAMFDMADRWEAVRTTLFDPTDGVVTELENDVRFGLSLYTSDDGFEGGTCPILTEAPPMLGNSTTMQGVFDMSMPVGDTPTGESLAAVAQGLAADPSPGEKLIVLATDGEPDTCDEPDPQNGQAQSVQAATDAFALGVKTAVISVGNEVSEVHLQEMANAGAGVVTGEPDEPFYQALDQAALILAFQEIIGTSRDCTFTLSDALMPNAADECMVAVNGAQIPANDPDGWQQVSATEIELVGMACDDIQDGEINISMECDCDAVSG